MPLPWPSACGTVVRIPLCGNVPTGPEVLALIDTAPVYRLRGVRQLGLAHLVYPGAGHTRLEHSLGVYAMARRMLGELALRGRGGFLSEEDTRTFLACCLLHDVGHYPFSHTLEEVPPEPAGRFHVVRHDERARAIILGDPGLQAVLRQHWNCDPDRICRIIDEQATAGGPDDARLRHMLCGPLNPDRLDYLARDSLHVGVPYGQNIDLDRLLAAMDFSRDGSTLCVSRKGVSAVETLIFASYLMYREVYWHHTIRAAQAMLKYAVVEALLYGEVEQRAVLEADDEQAMALLRACRNPATGELTRALGPGRGLYRRVWSGGLSAAASLPPGAGRDLLLRLGAVDAWSARPLLAETASSLATALRTPVAAHHLLYDIAGRDKELFFEVPLLGPGALTTANPEVSLVAPTLASNFERHAKRLQLLAPSALAREAARFLALPDPDEPVVT